MKLLVVKNIQLRFQEIGQNHIDRVLHFVDTHKPDLIVMAGNYSQYEKRSVIFAEQIANATHIDVVYNIGILECCNFVTPEFIKDALILRFRINSKKTNVYWAVDYISDEIEFKCVVGWPTIQDTQENYENSFAGRWLAKERSPLYLGDERLCGSYPKPYTVEEFNIRYLTENLPIWSTNKKKILLTSIDQEKDDFLTVNYFPTRHHGEEFTIGSSGEQLSIIEV